MTRPICGAPWGNRVPAMLVVLGACALAIGVLVYLTDRDPTRAALVRTVSELPGSTLFGTVGGWLPSFTHAFAFSLFTAAIGRSGTADPAYGACALWWAIDTTFELAQVPQVSHGIVDAIESALAPSWLTDAMVTYLVHGTFDVADLVAVAGGALAAAVVLRSLQQAGGIRTWLKSR